MRGTSHRSLVTGGCGFIGHHLVRALRERGDYVRVLDIRPWAHTSHGNDDGVEAIVGSITDADVVRRAMQGIDRVFHLAANPNLWAPDPGHFHEVNYLGTCRVLDEAIRQRVQRFIYTSSESILKSMRTSRKAGRVVIDETARLGLEDMPGPYCRSKFRAEEAAHEAAAGGFPLVIVNPTMPLGPGDGLLTPPTRMVLGFVNGQTPAYLDCEFNLVDARDAAFGHVMAAEHGRVGERYILGNENIELGDLLAELSMLTGHRMPRLRVPYCLAFLASVISEGMANLRKQPPIAPITGVRLARSSMAFNCGKARRELGWQTRPLRQTLYDALLWFREAGLLTRQIAMPSRSDVMLESAMPPRPSEEFPMQSLAAD